MILVVTRLAEHLEKIRAAIEAAALKSGRKASDVKLMAATKTVDDRRIIEAIEALSK